MSSETFHPFPKLPPELRLKIWQFAQPEREIFQLYSANTKRTGTCKQRQHIIVPLRTVPSLFHACSESREVALGKNTVGVYSDGKPVVHCSHLVRRTRHYIYGNSGEMPCRDVYWRPKTDVMIITHDSEQMRRAAYALPASQAPLGGLHSYGIQHIILPLIFFCSSVWDPRVCGHTWGMETVFIVLKRKTEDTPEFWEDHLAWFGRWWLIASKDWMQVVGEDAPLKERVPFLPKAVWCSEGEELSMSDLDKARECVLVEDNAPLTRWDSEKLHAARYFGRVR